jgi:hypothetical protein
LKPSLLSGLLDKKKISKKNVKKKRERWWCSFINKKG